MSLSLVDRKEWKIFCAPQQLYECQRTTLNLVNKTKKQIVLKFVELFHQDSRFLSRKLGTLFTRNGVRKFSLLIKVFRCTFWTRAFWNENRIPTAVMQGIRCLVLAWVLCTAHEAIYTNLIYIVSSCKLQTTKNRTVRSLSEIVFFNILLYNFLFYLMRKNNIIIGI